MRLRKGLGDGGVMLGGPSRNICGGETSSSRTPNSPVFDPRPSLPFVCEIECLRLDRRHFP